MLKVRESFLILGKTLATLAALILSFFIPAIILGQLFINNIISQFNPIRTHYYSVGQIMPAIVAYIIYRNWFPSTLVLVALIITLMIILQSLSAS